MREACAPKAVASQPTPSVAPAAPVPAPAPKEIEVPLPVQKEIPAPRNVVDSAPRRELVFSQRESRPMTAVRQQRQEPHITNNWEDASIADVLAMFAAFTGRTILPSKNVTGKVTASIIDLPWDVALKEIMNANGYDVSVNPDGVIVVDTYEAIAARQATIPLQNRTVRLNYSRAMGVKEMVAARLTRVCTTVGPAAAAQAQAGAQQPQLPNAIMSTTCRGGGNDETGSDNYGPLDQHHRRPVALPVEGSGRPSRRTPSRRSGCAWPSSMKFALRRSLWHGRSSIGSARRAHLDPPADGRRPARTRAGS